MKKSMSMAVLALLAALPLAAQISLSFQSTPRSVSAAYLLDSPVVLNESLTVRHRGNATPYFVTFSAGQSGSFMARAAISASGGQLLYQIRDAAGSSSVLKDLSANPSLSEVLAGSLPASGGFQRIDSTFVIELQPAQFPPAGTYQDSLRISLYEGTPANPGALRDSATMNLRVTMNTVLELSLTSQGGLFNAANTSLNLNFGQLAAGQRLSADILVRSNAPYSVFVASQNGGALKPADPADASMVPYLFSVDGTAASLAAGAQATLAAGAASTGYSGTRYRISIQIQEFGMATEGPYTDILTFSVAAN